MTADGERDALRRQPHALLTSQQPAEALALGAGWAAAGDDVTVVLLDAATAVLRPGHDAAKDLTAAHDAGVRVWAEVDALTERMVDTAAAPAEIVDLDDVAALLGDPETKAQWW